MTKIQENFVDHIYGDMCKLNSKTIGVTYKMDYFDVMTFTDKSEGEVNVEIKDGNLYTNVFGTQYTDVCPMKGSRRDRNAMATIVADYVCKAFGTTLEDYVKEIAERIHNLRNSIMAMEF